MHRGSRKRTLTSANLQTIYTDVHRNYLQSVKKIIEEKSYGDFEGLFEAFWDFSFIEGFSSLKAVVTPTHLDMNNFNQKLTEAHLNALKDLFSHSSAVTKTEHMAVVEEILKDFIEVENKHHQLFCETKNALDAETSVKIEELRKRDDNFLEMKKENLTNAAKTQAWFTENRDVLDYIKMKKLVCYWILHKNINVCKECSTLLANQMQILEDEELLKNTHEYLLQNADLYARLHNRRGIFDSLSERFDEYDIDLIKSRVTVGPPESFFRRSRGQWSAIDGTPGFQGCEAHNFHLREKVKICTDGEYFGHALVEANDLAGRDLSQENGHEIKEIDIFTVDEKLLAKVKQYLGSGPSLENWKQFLRLEYIPGSALFFGPSLVGPPSEDDKPSFFAVLTKCPEHAFSSNAVTAMGFNLSFFVMSFENGEFYLGTQEKLELKNSNQRRKVVLKKNAAVNAQQLPGKRAISSDYRNIIYYGKKLTVDEAEDDGKLFQQ